MLQAGSSRTQRVRSSISGAGLDTPDADQVLADVSAQGDAHVCVELLTLVDELEWRLRELERVQQMRASLLPEHAQGVIGELIRRLRSPEAPPG